ncbi:hypothetical protein CRN79_18225 [Serratia fonticola]|uniref:hypothetical protein n=1 Tax=Serratia fonticola TaxID=47917 RepID=UPI000BFDA977|nr:hypothetical protein [Serratia fonticola]ATM77656.1 hypothetical protein CRN79_18225 [Serratia fonticola]MBC3248926.1 hypothetical protein [Serratia fonticola]
MKISRAEIEVKGGKITDDTLFTTDLDGSVDYIDQDVLLIEYANNTVVDISFYDSTENLSVNVISGFDWEHPVYRKIIARHDRAGLLASLKEAIDIAVKSK